MRYPFLGGAVGYLSYDLGFVLEDKVGKAQKDDLNIPDVVFICITPRLFWIMLRDYCIFLPWITREKKPFGKKTCRVKFKKILKLVSAAKESPVCKEKKGFNDLKELSSNFTKTEYLSAVKKPKNT